METRNITVIYTAAFFDINGDLISVEILSNW